MIMLMNISELENGNSCVKPMDQPLLQTLQRLILLALLVEYLLQWASDSKSVLKEIQEANKLQLKVNLLIHKKENLK